MTRVLSLQDDWRHVATIEIAEPAARVPPMPDGTAECARLVPSEHSPPGSTRFDVMVDFGIGAREAAHAAGATLVRLQLAADRGTLPGYRIVNGQHWLELSSTLG